MTSNTVAFSPPHSRVVADLAAADHQDRAEDRADQRFVEKVGRARTEQEDQDRHEKIEAAVNPASLLQAEPPSAETLGINTDGLPPQRARLIRYRAWLTALERDLAVFEQGRTNYLVSIGAVATTEAEIAKLRETDQGIFGAWLRSGGEQAVKPLLRGQQREDLERCLADRKHERDVAIGALDDVEFAIDTTGRKLEILRTRGETFLTDALIEAAGATCDLYRIQAEELQRTLCSLYALATIAQQRGPFDGGAVAARDRFYPGSDPSAGNTFTLPPFGALRDPKIACDRDDIRQAAKPWQQLAATWRNDPRSDPPAEA